MTNIKVKEEPAETLKTQTCVREPNPAFPCLCGLHTACSMMLLTLTKTVCVIVQLRLLSTEPY